MSSLSALTMSIRPLPKMSYAPLRFWKSWKSYIDMSLEPPEIDGRILARDWAAYTVCHLKSRHVRPLLFLCRLSFPMPSCTAQLGWWLSLHSGILGRVAAHGVTTACSGCNTEEAQRST